MKLKLITLLGILSAFLNTTVTAQVDITIGTGTAANTGTTYPCPLQDYFEGSRAQYLYRASELTAAGMGPGAISEIKFTVTGLATFSGTIEEFAVRIGGSTATTLSATTWEPVSTAVFGPVNYVPAVGVNTITFTTPFFWNGTDNIVIEMCNGDANNGDVGVTTFTNNPLVTWTIGLPFNGSHTYYADNLGNLCGTPTTTNFGLQTSRPNIIFRYTNANACTGTPLPGTAIASVINVCQGTPFSLNITNGTLESGLTYQWQSSPDNINWTNISGATSATYNATQSASTYYRRTTTCTTGGATVASTSVRVFTPTATSGTFTINSAVATGGTNFQSYNAAYDYIKCGINGPVVFNVQPGSGPYNEQLIMTPVPGASAANTVTFNGNGTTLQFSSINTNERAVIKLNNADHIRFDSLVIDATPVGSATTYGYGVQFINNADSNVVRRCTINAAITGTSTNYAGIVISASATSATTTGLTLCDSNFIAQNTITGGYYAITLVGSTTVTDLIQRNTVLNNNFREYYFYGIYLSGTSNTLIEGNDFQRPARTDVSAFYGVFSTGLSVGVNVSKNRIHNPFGGDPGGANAFYGIYFNLTDATIAAENKVSNNLIYDVNGQGLIYALYNIGSDNIHYYHNTISLDNAASTSTLATRGFFQTTAASGIRFFNNIISISRGGIGDKHAVYLATAASTVTLNRNDYYVNAAAGANSIGFSGTLSYATLATWQIATSQDDKSISTDPLYSAPGIGDFRPLAIALDNAGAGVGITTDILGTPRNATSPDIGAYEFSFLICSGTPVPGVTATSASGICLNVSFTLTVTGAGSLSGLTYQWQSSPDNLTWTNIAGATGVAYNTAQSTSTYYRRVTTCTNGGGSAPSTPVQVISPSLVSGTFTINSALPTGGTNFQTFAAAYNHIKCGINGPVIFNVLNGTTGTYNEQLIMTAVPGASATNTVTFKGNGVAAINFASANPSERAVIKLTGANYIIFDSLVINANTGSYGWGVQLINDADSNVVRNCIINSSVTDITQNYAGVVINGSATSITTATATSLNDDNIITGNTITGGFAGVAMVATVTGANGYNTISRNKILDFYQYGIYVAGSYFATIESDSIARPNRTNSAEISGIYFTAVSTDAFVSKNKITNPFGGQPTGTIGFNGINFVNCDAESARPNIVSNNLIYNINGLGAISGLANTGSDNVTYLHNTISLDNTASTATATTRGFFQTTAAGGILLFNNLITISRGGTGAKHCIYFATNTTGFLANYNDYVNTAAAGTNFIGFFTTNQPTLAAWRAATGKDGASISRLPFYNDPAIGDYSPTNGGVDNLGTYAEVPVDIRYFPRSTVRPDMGAYEFTAPGCTLPVIPGNTVFGDSTVCQNVPVLLSLTIGAWGSNQTFQWQGSISPGGPFTNVGGPRPYPDTVIISTISQYYRCEVTCGGSTLYSNPVFLQVTPSLPTGTYTINKTLPTTYPLTGTNFASFNDAKASMSCGIIGGPVVFNVVPGTGPYTEQLRLDSIAGTSATNTITFNGNGNTISFASANSNERAVIKLNAADYIIFDSLTINAANGTFGYGVQLINRADSNVFRKCRIISSLTSASTNFAGVVINAADAGTITTGATLCDANLFDRDSIIGGYYGITLVGITGSPVIDNRFTNNVISDYYSTGFYIAGTTNTLIEGNTFTRPTRATAANPVYSVYATVVLSNRLRVSKNRFTKPFGGAPANATPWFGIYHNAVDATAGSENIVSNNLFYDLDGNGSLNPLYNNGSDNVRYHHNTISLDNLTSTSTAVTQGFYQTTVAIGIEFYNNIITIKRGGNGAKHAIYFATNTSEVESDNNDFYVKAGGANNHVGFFNSSQTTLAAWQAASTEDDSSLSIDPVYISPATGNYAPGLLPLDNKGIPVGITTDILNAPRSNITPDMGAYEFAPPLCTSPPIAGTATVTPNTGVCLEAPIRLTLTGNSLIGTLTFQWQSAPTAAGPWTNLSPVQYTPDYDTVTTVNTFYRCLVNCNGNTVISNTTSVTLNSVPMAGIYTIDPAGTGSRNFATFQTAVAALLCGIGDKVTFNVAPVTFTEQVRIPYIPGTSTVKTITFQKDPVAAGTATLTNASTPALNYTLRLDSAGNIIIRNLAITGTNATYGRVIELFNSAYNDSIINCTISAPVTIVAANTTAGVYAAAFRGRNIVIKGNTFTNGANGIYFTGPSAAVLANPLLIDSNNVSGSYSHGIFTQYTNRIRIRGNTVNLGTPQAANSAGFYLDYIDTAFRLTGNTVNINNNTSGAYGIDIRNSRSVFADSSIITGNRIIADAGNTGALYGIGITLSKGINNLNNVISLNSTGATAIVYGLYHLNNADAINHYNNSISIRGASATGYAGYFNQLAKAAFNVKNNVFSNPGGGKALFVSNPSNFTADYNLLNTTGALLTQTATGTVTTFANLKTWTNAWNWDRWSISYPPAFVSPTDLRPDIANPDVWAMHGRGTQITYNTYDFNNNYRPDVLTAGVPDLGAYEFYPSALPTVMLATPATPAPNVTQTFSYGTDTVMRITWGATAPPTLQVRRFSGVVPTGLLQPGTDSMYFYTQVTIPGGGNYPYAAKLYYIDPWQGSIPSQNVLGMGRTTPSNAWVVGANSRVNVSRREITQDAIIYLDRFTGLVNPFAQIENEDSSSNRGKDFWVGYQRTNGFTATGGSQDMVVYMGAATQDAHVTITIENSLGTPWIRNYTVPAGSALASDLIPKIGADDARLVTEGRYLKKGIHIVSDVPIVAYAHIYESTNSGATMLMPTSVWGYEYYTLSSRQNYTSVSYSAFHIVAKDDSTWVEINPTNPTLGGWVANGGTQPNGSYLVKLNKGDAYQVLGANLSGDEGYDLTGSYVKSVANAQGTCSPIAVFAGSTRTSLGCAGSSGGGGDLIIQQIFPYQAWGNKYLTAPTSNAAGPNAGSNMTNIYRVLVKDPTTIVKRNGVTITGIINNRYYQFESGTGDYIESNKPILLAQYLPSSGPYCPNSAGDGDPEMFYISPVQQAIKSTQFYLNSRTAIRENFVTLIIPTEGLATLKIDGIGYGSIPAAEKYDYNHPNLAGYTVVTKKWTPAVATAATVESEQAFTGIVYGLGSVESYGYNLGTLVKNLNNSSSVNNDLNTGPNATGYTCKNAPFKLKVLLPLTPDSIFWRISALAPHLTPGNDTMQRNLVAVDTTQINGIDYYGFVLNVSYTIDTAGIFSVPIVFWSPLIEKCDKKQDGRVIIQVLPAPATDFRITYPNAGTAGCAGDVLSFTGDLITQNGIALNQWQWTFNNGITTTTPTGQQQSFAYPNAGLFDVKLRGITADGCISDTVKKVTINPRPVVNVVADSIGVCPNGIVSFTVANPVTGSVYRWYSTPTGGTPLFAGITYTPTVTTLPVSYYVDATSAAGCVSVTRKKVTAYQLPLLAVPVVTQTASTANSVIFTWTAVVGAISYEVSVNSGAFAPPSGPGLTHTVTGLLTLSSTNIIVRANGANTCQSSLSTSISGCTNSTAQVVPDSLAVCRDSAVTFTVTPAEAGITYTWFSTATGGTALFTGSSYTVAGITATSTFYVQQTRATSGCTSTERKRVVVTVLPQLAPTTAFVDTVTVNSVRFRWNAVTGAATYQVSVAGGPWITPSSGPAGLFHIVTGLRHLDTVSLRVRAIGAITCQTSTSAAVTGRTLPDQIYIPNTFSPNGDGLNDVLQVYGYIIRNLTFTVFNQWGQKIYESNQQNRAWDGTFKDKQQPVGVYIYVCKLTLLNGTVETRKGTINLVR